VVNVRAKNGIIINVVYGVVNIKRQYHIHFLRVVPNFQIFVINIKKVIYYPLHGKLFNLEFEGVIE